MSWLFALIIIGWTRTAGRPFASLGLTRNRPGLGVSVIAGFLFGVLLKLTMKAVVMPLLRAPAINQAYHYLAGNTGALPGIITLVLVSGAVAEEIVYRGFLFDRARALWGSSSVTTANALAISTVLFAASHYVDQDWPGVVQAAFTGLTFGAIYAWRNELWTPMAVHAGFDLAAVAMIYANWEEPLAHLFFRRG
jgi:membrane protease YdiL (CAAX protease family)